MNAQTVVPIDPNAVTELSKRNQEPVWMSELRVKGLELAGSLDLPKLEKTRIDRWSLDSYGQYKTSDAVRTVADLPDEARALFGENFSNNLMIQRNSTAVYSRISDEASSQGVLYCDLGEALRKYPELVQPYFMKAVEQTENRLTAIHSAVWSGGVFLYIPKNVSVKLPFHALFYNDDREAACSPHVLIVAEANSSVTYVENVMSIGAGSGDLVMNGVVEVFAKNGAKVQFASVRSLQHGVTDIVYRRAVLDNDSRIEWIVGEMNDGNVMSDTTSLLQGNGSASDTKVICVGSGEQKMNLTTRAVHFGQMSESDMITRAVMRDEATAIINGVTKIEKGSTGANGEQTEKVLMLSPKARGDANPILLIDEDDVKAGHAASVGQVNPEQIYYLMSRGISKDEAARLIIHGFLAPVIAEIPITKLEEQLQQLVERKLGQ